MEWGVFRRGRRAEAVTKAGLPTISPSDHGQLSPGTGGKVTCAAAATEP
jgi:hypothetical protein